MSEKPENVYTSEKHVKKIPDTLNQEIKAAFIKKYFSQPLAEREWPSAAELFHFDEFAEGYEAALKRSDMPSRSKDVQNALDDGMSRVIFTDQSSEMLVNAELKKEIERLEKLVYVPGLWKCAKCKCTTVCTNLHVNTGGFSANNSPQQCPNDCGPMWRVTERDAGNELIDRYSKDADHKRLALKELHELIDGGEECQGRDSQISHVIGILEGDANHLHVAAPKREIGEVSENEIINFLEKACVDDNGQWPSSKLIKNLIGALFHKYKVNRIEAAEPVRELVAQQGKE
jgi:hypothetical protein